MTKLQESQLRKAIWKALETHIYEDTQTKAILQACKRVLKLDKAQTEKLRRPIVKALETHIYEDTQTRAILQACKRAGF